MLELYQVPDYAAKVTPHQVALLRAAGLEVRIYGCSYRVFTKNWPEVETLHRIVPDPNHSPVFVNGNFRTYLATLTQ